MKPGNIAHGVMSLLTILGFRRSDLTPEQQDAQEKLLDKRYASIPLPLALRRFLDRRMRSENRLTKKAVAYVFRAHEHVNAESNAAVLPAEVLATKPDLTGALVIAPNWFFKSNLEAHYGIIMRRCPTKRGHWEVVFPVEKDCRTYELPQKDLTSWPIALAPFKAPTTRAAVGGRRTAAAADPAKPLRRSDRLAAKNNPTPTPEPMPTPPPPPPPCRAAAPPQPAPPANPTPAPRRRSPRFTPTTQSTPVPAPTCPPPSPHRRPEPMPQPTPEPTPVPAYIPPHKRDASSGHIPAAEPTTCAVPRPVEPQGVDVAFFGLGTHGGPNELTAAAQTVINWVHFFLGVNLGQIEVLKRTRVRYPRAGRHPDIVVVRMTRKAKRALFRAKRQLPGHVPVSIGVHREGPAHFQHCEQRRARSAAYVAGAAAANPTPTEAPLITIPPPPPPPRAAPAAAPCPTASGAGPSHLNPAAAPYTGPAATAGQGQGNNGPPAPTSGPGEGSGSGSGSRTSHGGGGGGDAQE